MEKTIEASLDMDNINNEVSFSEEENHQFVTFFIDEECFGFDMDVVQEIIWVPDTVPVPLTPPFFLGLANLRGNILPILDLRKILNKEEKEITDASRVIIVNVNQPVGFLVDKVDRVIQVEKEEIDYEEEEIERVHTEFLSKVVKHPQNPAKLIQILDAEKIIQKEISFETSKRSDDSLDISKTHEKKDNEDTEEEFFQIISFDLKDQEFGFEVFDIKEIVRFPEEIHEVPNVDPAFMGIISYREEMLPIINLSMLLSLESNYDPERSRVLVLSIQKDRSIYSVGFVVDKVNEILKVSKEEWEEVPELLEAHSSQSEIKAICRLEKGKRIVPVLSVKGLTAHPAVESAISITKEHKENQMEEEYKEATEEELQLVIFKLQDEEYGIFIEHIQEIILVPEEINVVPQTPDYIEGMINLRGSVLPVIDMRKRLGLPEIERQDSQRIIVLHTKGVKMGFIVDSVVEVLCVNKGDVEEVPKMSSEQAAVLDKVINLKDQNRIILIINVEKLFGEEEIEEISSLSEGAEDSE